MAILSKYLSRRRLELISPHVHGSVLDIGCQSGQMRDILEDQIHSYTGIDMSPRAIKKANENHPDCVFKILNIDDDELGFYDEFDTIIMSAVIEHLFNLKFVGQNLASALRPGGKIVLTTPTNFGNDFVHRFGSALGLFSKDARDDHIAILNKKRFEIFAKEVDLTIEEYRLFQFGCNQLVILKKEKS